MSYLNTLSAKQRENAAIVVDRAKKGGITSPFSLAAILSVISKESGFMPQNEVTYANTPNARIRAIFGSRVANLSEAQLESLKKNDAAFYEQVYGMQWNHILGLGNTQKGDGYKYRGRGFNGITGRYLYDKYGKLTGHNLIDNPDKLNEIPVAADVAVAYFKNQFASPNNRLSAYSSTGINDFSNVKDSTLAFYHANAGWGKTPQQIMADTTGGLKRALDRAPEFYVWEGITKGTSKKKMIVAVGAFVVLAVSGYLLYKNLKTK